MTYDASSTHVSNAGSNSVATGREMSGMHPFTVWHAMRQAGHFVLDVVNEAGQLRRSLHRRYRVIEE